MNTKPNREKAEGEKIELTIIHADCIDAMKEMPDNSVDSLVTDPPYGLSFMGKKWDYDVPSKEIWQEALRVLKPGGHLLSFGGSRTYHRMAVAIEDAGFEIRDQIQWIYGSGFPKSLNIGKAVDKLQRNEREIMPNPKAKQQTQAKDGIYGDYEATTHISRGTSQWEGWGTALKPAHEPIVVARKPLSEKTVAENVLRWGTGGINIDGSRVEYESKQEKEMVSNRSGIGGHQDEMVGGRPKDMYKFQASSGRFPANFIHDGSDEVVGLFPDTKSGVFNKRKTAGIWDDTKVEQEFKGMSGDSGSASRFFYCAKASKRERNAGCEGMEEKELENHSATFNVRMENGVATNKRTDTKRQNNHPTVKPIALMQYLVKLVTPPQGIVLDPFMGSGTTGIACKRGGFEFIGIEMDEEYYKIAEARLKYEKHQT